MKIFKHRGDIYVSKTGYKSSREERILLIILAVIIVLTVVFLVVMNNKYSSFSQFIAGDDVTVSEQVQDENFVALPQISGKKNFIVYETDDEESTIHFAYLVQMDGDNMSYKVCTLSPKMKIDGDTLYDLFLSGGGALIQSKLTSYLGVNIDYYVDFETSDLVEFINSLGEVVYPMPTAIKYTGGSDDDRYSVRVGDGEQSLSGKDNVSLMRYFSNDDINLSTTNEIIIYSLTQLFSADNYERADSLFRLFISNTSTNITVRDFENGRDFIMVFCNKNTDLTVYSCTPQYKKGQLTADSLQEIKGYFGE